MVNETPKRNLNIFIENAREKEIEKLRGKILRKDIRIVENSGITYPCYFCGENLLDRVTSFMVCDDKGFAFPIDKKCLRHFRTFLKQYNMEISMN